MGENYVEHAFLYARKTVEALGADIDLYYNDYNAFFPEKARGHQCPGCQSVNTFAQDGRRPGTAALMDGVGMQGYIGGYGTQEGCLERVPS